VLCCIMEVTRLLALDNEEAIMFSLHCCVVHIHDVPKKQRL